MNAVHIRPCRPCVRIRLTIEEIAANKARPIYVTQKPCEETLGRNKTIRYMLATAGECFRSP